MAPKTNAKPMPATRVAMRGDASDIPDAYSMRTVCQWWFADALREPDLLPGQHDLAAPGDQLVAVPDDLRDGQLALAAVHEVGVIDQHDRRLRHPWRRRAIRVEVFLRVFELRRNIP